MNKSFSILMLLVAALVVLAYGALYIVPEGKQAIVTQFGKPVGEPITQAGLHVKLPFIQDVRYLEQRILNWDGSPNQIPTKDKKYIYVDTTARWKIVDSLEFIMTVQNERRALDRVSAIIDSATRNVISSHTLVETVRTDNKILDEIRKVRKARQEALKAGELIEAVEEEVTGEIERVLVGREQLSRKILEEAGSGLTKLGIDLIDVQLRGIAYEESVQNAVYQRMISERERIAEKIRSIGKGEVAKIRGKTEEDLLEIQSEAYREVQEIKGEAEAQAIGIYADAVKDDTEFYHFTRTLEAYKSGLRNDTRFILSGDTNFFEVLREGSP